MHESVRWLLARGKVDRAVSILAAIAKTNGKSVSVDYLQQNIKVLCMVLKHGSHHFQIIFYLTGSGRKITGNKIRAIDQLLQISFFPQSTTQHTTDACFMVDIFLKHIQKRYFIKFIFHPG